MKIGGAASVAALTLGLIGSGGARGQVTPLQINVLAQGTSNGEPVNLHIARSNDVLQTELVFQVGAETGWHFHPGPVVVVIKSGALTEIKSDGCVIVHPAGSVFFEEKDVIHNAINQSSGVTDVYATFLLPEGTQPLIPAANPGQVCSPDRNKHQN